MTDLKLSNRSIKGGLKWNSETGVSIALPNGREVVVITKPDDGRIQLRGWERFDSEYEKDGVGRLLTHGKSTAWDMENLRDTGRTAEHFGTSI